MAGVDRPERYAATAPRLHRSAFVFGLGNVMAAGIPFLLLPVLTRHLSQEAFGIVAMFQVMVGIADPLAGLVLHAAIYRMYFDRDKVDFPSYITSCLLAIAASSAVLTGVVLAASGVIERYTSVPAGWLWAVVLSAALNQLILTNLGLWRAEMRAARFGVFRILYTVANIGISLLLVVGCDLGWQGRILGHVASTSLFGLASLALLWRGGWLSPRAKGEYVAKALWYGGPLVPHALGMWLIAATDRTFITNMVGLGTTGVYAVGYQIGQIIGLLQHSFNMAWTPWLFARLKTADGSTKRHIVRFTYVYALAITALAMLLTLAAPYLLAVLVGEEFREASTFVFWIAVGMAFNGMYKMVTNYIFYVGKTHLLSAVTFVTAAVNVPLNYFLILRNGAVGAAQATAIALFISFLLTWIVASRVYPMPWALWKRRSR